MGCCIVAAFVISQVLLFWQRLRRGVRFFSGARAEAAASARWSGVFGLALLTASVGFAVPVLAWHSQHLGELMTSFTLPEAVPESPWCSDYAAPESADGAVAVPLAVGAIARSAPQPERE